MFEDGPKSCNKDAFGAEVLESFECLFRDFIDSGHYTGDYATKFSEAVGDLLPELAVGIRRLEQDEAEANAGRRAARDMDGLVDLGWRTLIRLETSPNRAARKTLPEMMFQMLFGHESHQSHETPVDEDEACPSLD